MWILQSFFGGHELTMDPPATSDVVWDVHGRRLFRVAPHRCRDRTRPPTGITLLAAARKNTMVAALVAASGSLAGRCASPAARVGSRGGVTAVKTKCTRVAAAGASSGAQPGGAPGGIRTHARAVGPGRARRLTHAVGAARGAACTTKASSEDAIYRVMSENQEVSVISVVGTKLVSEAVARHKTAPTATAALGRSMLGALLLGTFKGDDETVQIMFKGDGPLGPITVIADNAGQVKGMVANPKADPPLRPDGKLNVGAAVGLGVLTVSRAHPDWKAPFTGMVPIVSGEIAEDIAVYLQESEQVNSAVAVGVSIDRELNVRSAGGYMVQVLPFASDETIAALEKTIPSLPSTTDMIADGLTAKEMAEKVLGELGSLPELATMCEPTYGPCDIEDLRGRMMRAIASMGREEVESIIEEQGKVEVTCEFCKDTIVFSEEDLFAAKEDI